MDKGSVVVAIPTFRRPGSLTKLLDEIARIPNDLRVVVADNDCDKAEGLAVVTAMKLKGYPHPLESIGVAERGIAPTRNALVSHIIADEHVALIAMIDDDERPMENWLRSLLTTQATTGAHVVGGPVIRRFEVLVPKYLEEANNYGPGRFKSGSIDFVDATSNVLFDAAVFRETEAPWFDPYFALTGGEDKDFMLSLRLRGKRFAWAEEAQVEETLPVSRCSTRWALQRAFSTGNSDMLVNLRRRPPDFSLAGEAMKILGALSVSVVNMTLFVFLPARRFDGMRLFARVMGKLSAVFGRRHFEYRTIHGA